MPNYNNSKIYRLIGGGLTYVGSTTLPLNQRKAQHASDWKRWSAGKKKGRVTSFELFETGEPIDIVLLERYSCETKEELHARERYWIEQMECVNRRVPGRGKAEWYETHRDEILDKQKAYRESNPEKKRARDKARYEAKKAAIREKHRQYRESNREAIRARQAKKVVCECGSEVRQGDIAQHRRTNKHQSYLASN